MYEDFLCERLAQLRVQKGVSARDMSISLGSGAGYINNIENKRNLPSMIMFFCICDYLKITPTDFFNEDVENPEKLNKLMCQLKSLNEQQLSLVSSIIEGLAK